MGASQQRVPLLNILLGLSGCLCLAGAAAMYFYTVRGDADRVDPAVKTSSASDSPNQQPPVRLNTEPRRDDEAALNSKQAEPSLDRDASDSEDGVVVRNRDIAAEADPPANDREMDYSLAVSTTARRTLTDIWNHLAINTRQDSEVQRERIGFRSSPSRFDAGADTPPAAPEATPAESSPTPPSPKTEPEPSDAPIEPEESEKPKAFPAIDSPHRGLPVVDYIIGNSDSDPRGRMVGWAIITKGWAHFVSSNAEPYFAAGVKRMILHNPFGTLPDEQMQLDQYLEALSQPGLRRLTHGFAKAWRPVTDRGIEMIAYVGCPRLDPDSKRIEEEEGRQAALDYAFRALQPFLDANMSIALDAAAPATSRSLTWALAEQLRARGVMVYVEARPLASNPHWFDFGVISTDPFWKRSNPERHPDSSWGARNDQITGEVLRMLVHNKMPPDFEGTIVDFQFQEAHKIQASGHTPIFMGGREAPPPRVSEFIATYHMASFD